MSCHDAWEIDRLRISLSKTEHLPWNGNVCEWLWVGRIVSTETIVDDPDTVRLTLERTMRGETPGVVIVRVADREDRIIANRSQLS